MEVAGAGQWRREWAGTAEYGKVTEGGVTRRVARAMEVLNASAPGARMRVVRAAYHQSASAGAPAASYLMHSSRTVISSGFNNMLEPPTFPSKPLEISSVPLESSPEPNTDTENYKVTEPDDFDISEPSKWRSGSGRTSIRMPSEESSSTDNASIIDLDARHKNIHRKYSYDSDIEVPPYRRNSSSRVSPLLDTPTALSTLKYKSLLNGSNDWTNRRKSYSFEDTPPLNETVTHSNDTLAMESSTDSGICKSTEIVNEPDDKYTDRKERTNSRQEEGTFKDWLFKNRANSSFYKGSSVRSPKHDVVIEEPAENNIGLHSTRKVSIRTVPITVADDYQYNDTDRRIKKVGFSKTELHFTVDSGKVNIIETDEKPPPTNDFRKRRSAFVPLQGACDKPITLFGDTTKEIPVTGTTLFTNTSSNEINEFEENTAATKSILKNKIPKPKPYLLGENMVLGTSSDLISNDTNYNCNVPTAVSLINKQLQLERRGSEETTTSFSTQTNSSVENKPYRTTNTGPITNDSLKLRKLFERENTTTDRVENISTSVKNKFNIPEISPKTRQLRNSDLAYFGVNNNPRSNFESSFKRDTRSASSSIDDLFQSVRLVQSVTNSACNSETESEDKPEYQNLPFKSNFAPIPTPRPRSKYDMDKDMKMLRPIQEQENSAHIDLSETRRSRLRRQEETVHSRSISEPRKSSRYNSLEKPTLRQNYSRSKKNGVIEDISLRKVSREKKQPSPIINEEEEPTYVNLNVVDKKGETIPERTSPIRYKYDKNKESPVVYDRPRSIRIRKSDEEKLNTANKTTKIEKKYDSNDLEMRRLKKIRTEKLATPEYNNEPTITKKSSTNSDSRVLDRNSTTRSSKHERREHSSLRNSTRSKPVEVSEDNVNKSTSRKDSKHKDTENDAIKHRTNHSSKDRSSKRESSNTRKQTEKNSPVSRNKDANVLEIPLISNSKSDDYKPSKRREYVINYDDKKGTVSSICKVKPGTGSSRSKKVPKEISKDSKSNRKATEKIALLQLPDHQWDPYEMNYAESKWRRKLHAQRTCQLL